MPLGRSILLIIIMISEHMQPRNKHAVKMAWCIRCGADTCLHGCCNGDSKLAA